MYVRACVGVHVCGKSPYLFVHLDVRDSLELK